MGVMMKKAIGFLILALLLSIPFIALAHEAGIFAAVLMLITVIVVTGLICLAVFLIVS